MPTKQDDLIFACDRALAGITEVKTNAVRLAQLEQQIKAAEGTCIVAGADPGGRKTCATVRAIGPTNKSKEDRACGT